MAGEFKTENLKIILKTPDGPNKFFVRSLHGTEGLSRLFRFDLDLLCADKKLDLAKLLGQGVTLQVMTVSAERVFVHGIVNRMRQTDVSPNYAVFQMEVVPALWRLSIGKNCRIFQEMTPPDIIHKVIADSKVDVLVKDRLEGSYEPREYCVQYQESDFAFISRLMEQYGIFYYFSHEDGKHTLNLCDKKSHHDTCPVEHEFEFLPTGSSGGTQDYIRSLEVERALCVGKHCTTDYNFKTPGTSLLCEESGDDEHEIFEYPGEFDKHDGGSSASALRLEEQEWPRHMADGACECRAFRSGHKFSLSKHARGEFDGDYVLVEVFHRASQSGEFGSETVGGPEEFDYAVSYRAIPADVPYRAPRTTPKPGVFGAQPAVVVGKAGEEIWTDKYGRIKVQFFWDREGKSDENSSCWIRCAYGVAGKTWGQIFIPRIGQEVLIGFLDGDPDRPIVIGGVYNDEQMPPYTLPDDQTKSTIKSRSSKGGGPPNFNEFRIEDKKGSEEIYLHAEKDYNQITENDRTEDVGHDRSLHVAHDKSEKVDNNKTITVGVDHIETIGANKQLQVGANHTEDIGSNMTITVATMLTETVGVNYAETVGAAMELTIGAAFTETVGAVKAQSIGANKIVNIGVNHSVDVGANESIHVGGDRTDGVDGAMSQTIGKDLSQSVAGAHAAAVTKEYSLSAKKVSIVAEDEITIKTGSSTIQMKKNGDILIEGKNLTVKGKGGKIIMKADKILQN